jgi:hypothetical protein
VAEQRSVDVTWVHADLVAYEPAQGAFDLVLLLYLHVPPEERRRILAAAQSALAPDGTLLVVGHDTDNIEHGVGGPQDASLLYTPDDLAGDLDLRGLEVEKAESVLRPVADEGRDAIDALLRARRPLAMA